VRVYVGIDLSGTERRPTAVCVARVGVSLEFHSVLTDEELVDLVLRSAPEAVAIDAPLTSPRSGRGLRRCDLEVRRLGVPILPPTMGPMRLLTERGSRIASALREKGLRVIEVYPRGAQRMMGLIGRGRRPDKKVADLVASRLGLRVERSLTVDEVDAMTCALIAYLHDIGLTVELGNPEEGTIVMPSTEAFASGVGKPSFRTST